MADEIKKGNSLQTAASASTDELKRRGASLYRDILSNVFNTAAKVQQNSKTAKNNLQEGVSESGMRMQKGGEEGIDLSEIEKIEAQPEADGFVSGVGVKLTMTDGNSYHLWVQTDTDDGQRGITEFYENNDEGVPAFILDVNNNS